MLADLDPKARVPDILAEYLQNEPQTEEETAAGLVLAVHRRWLNGGFETTISNVEAIELSIDACLEAYLKIALPDAAKVLDAAAEGRRIGISDERWDALDERYRQIVYCDPAGVDAVEAAVIVFAQGYALAFVGAEAALQM